MIERLEAVARRTVPRETLERLRAYEAMLIAESRRQNLVSAASLDAMWERHFVDSAQLVAFETGPGASWIDVGSGAGFPGIVIACIVSGPVTLVEPRRLRADFLHRVCESLQLSATVLAEPVERTRGHFDVIVSRAVAPLRRLLEISQHLSTRKTRWVLPRGRSAEAELAEVAQSWQGVFHVEQSATDADSKIVVASGVGARR